MKNELNKRKIILLFLLLNLSVYITISMFFPFEKGVNFIPVNEAAENWCASCPSNIFKIYRDGEGKGKNFFIENFNSAYGDGANYMAMALGHESIPPYSLRPFMPKFVGGIADILMTITGMEKNDATKLNLLQPVMSLTNAILLMFAVVLVFLTLTKFLKDELMVGVISIFMLINIGNIQTAQFFMLDSASYFFAALIIYLFVDKKYFFTSVAIALGILIKEVMIIYAALLLFPMLKKELPFLKIVALGLIPLSVFVGLRVFMGVDPLSMQYSWNVSKGEINLHYLVAHLGSLQAIIIFIIKIVFTFGVLWFFSVFSIKTIDKKLLVTFAVLILAIIFANALLASRVPRVIFVMFPVIAILATIGIKNILKPTELENEIVK